MIHRPDVSLSGIAARLGAVLLLAAASLGPFEARAELAPKGDLAHLPLWDHFIEVDTRFDGRAWLYCGKDKLSYSGTKCLARAAFSGAPEREEPERLSLQQVLDRVGPVMDVRYRRVAVGPAPAYQGRDSRIARDSVVIFYRVVAVQ